MLYAQLEGADAASRRSTAPPISRSAASRSTSAPPMPRRRASRAGAGRSAGLADALGAHPQPAARPRRPNLPEFDAERDRLRDRHRAGADRADPLYRAARRAVRSRPHRPDARRRRASRARSAPMLVIPVMTTGSTAYSFEYPQRMAARLGPVPHRRQPDRLCPHRRRAASIRCCSTPPRPSGAGAAGGGCCSTNMAPPTSSSPRSTLRRALSRAGRRSASSPPATGPDSACARPLRAARREQRRRCRRMLDEGVRRMDVLYRQALDAGPAPARSEPGHHRRRRCRRRSRRRPRTPLAEDDERRRPVPTGAEPDLQRPGRDARCRRGPAGRGLGEPGRRRHLGDHHQPRARRHLGDAGHLRRRRRRLPGRAAGAGLDGARW